MTRIVIPVNPMGKPRMTQRDKWKKRPVVLRYHAFCDELRLYIRDLPEEFRVDFYLTMPKSWSKKKKAAMKFQPHQEKPDLDNLQKSILDAICKEDKQVWNIHAKKYWAAGLGGIIIFKDESCVTPASKSAINDTTGNTK